MPDAYTFDEGNGSVKTFKTRRDMYNWMTDNGHPVLEGDDADVFAQMVSIRSDQKAVDMAATIRDKSTRTQAVATALAVVARGVK